MIFQNIIKKKLRIHFEDILKHIYNCEYRQENATILSIAGALGFRVKKTVNLIEKMGKKGLVRISGNGFHLTSPGKAWALQMIRAHRLWESYLSDEKGIPLGDIHAQAEMMEHSITPDEADKLEAQLRYPVRDPHGDPIPSADQAIEQKKGASLVDWPTGKLGRIVHIEDEPQTIFTQILAEGLLPGVCVKTIESGERGLHIWTSLHECWIAHIVASNIFVEAAPNWMGDACAEPLSALMPGEKGKVLTLKCQGLSRRRFLDLGIIPNTVIEAVMVSALGDPLAYNIRGSMIALRKEQADMILVQRYPKAIQS